MANILLGHPARRGRSQRGGHQLSNWKTKRETSLYEFSDGGTSTNNPASWINGNSTSYGSRSNTDRTTTNHINSANNSTGGCAYRAVADHNLNEYTSRKGPC